MTWALAVLQQTAVQTPDTTGSLAAGYTAIGVLLVGYVLFLWARYRKAR
jgi:hypothetical protein